ncbi:ribonuclease P protein component [Georhizobium profundi]|jgi:ribonuclease P protein component|uniref:Ribonuclease P protein component n=1 Tax=Georhizobium profundi TaxID=2341112 RepID=A0A3S9AZ51_9HYPH|nr:ribonuclease P protein component [Georhizobium profundi]AZN69976.1 ribonuclease P protein component [Georhizobium profundi]GLQ39917.1 ribonuclease P protein component [Rhizobium albus]
MLDDKPKGNPQRLKRRADFVAMKTGQKHKGPFFLLETRSRGDDEPPRVGFTLTKRQGNAVERNRMKRRLREAVRLSGAAAMKPGVDYVLVGRRDMLSAPFCRLTAAIKERIEGPRSQSRPKTGSVKDT